MFPERSQSKRLVATNAQVGLCVTSRHVLLRPSAFEKSVRRVDKKRFIVSRTKDSLLPRTHGKTTSMLMGNLVIVSQVDSDSCKAASKG